MRMLIVVAVVGLGLAACGGKSSPAPTPEVYPDIATLVKVDGPSLTCDDALMSCTPLGAPTTCSCFWTCVSAGGANLTRAVQTYTRAGAADDWVKAFGSYYVGSCPK